MKVKTMVVAAILAATTIGGMSGANAACQYIPKEVVVKTNPAWAYKWKFSGKTTKAVQTKCSRQPGEFVTRISTSLKIQGWSFYCEPSCGDFETMECDEVFWQTKPSKTILPGGVSIEVANVIGKKGKNYEAAGVAEFDGMYELTFAGFGKYDAKNERVSSIKGNFAGFAAAPSLTFGKASTCTVASSELSKVWECCGCPTALADSIAFGKLTVKFDKSAAKRYNAGKPVKVPSWCY